MSEQASDTTQTIEPMQPPADAGGAAKRKVDPGFRRNMIFIGVVIAVGVLGTVLVGVGMFKNKSRGASVDLAANVTAVPNGGLTSTPQEKAEEAARQAQAASDALARGESVYIPSQTVANPVPITPQEPAASSVEEAPVAVPSNADQQLSASDQERLQRQREGLGTQLSLLLKSLPGGDGQQDQVQRVAFKVDSTATAVGGTSAGGGGAAGVVAAVQAASSSTQAPVAASAMATGRVLAHELEIVAAEVANDVDTYRTTMCNATVVAGRLAGAYLRGTCTQQEDGLSMRFTRMSFRGKGYAIDAIAMDEKTASDALSNTDVDYRYLQRYVFPILTAGIAAGATTYAQTGSTETVTAGGTVISTPEASRRQAVAAAVGAGANVLNAVVGKEASKPVQITMKAKLPIGVMFNTEVREQASR